MKKIFLLSLLWVGMGAAPLHSMQNEDIFQERESTGHGEREPIQALEKTFTERTLPALHELASKYQDEWGGD